jgi:hypothetical protein
MLLHLFFVNRRHQLACCNRFIEDNKIKNYKIIYFYKGFDKHLKKEFINLEFIYFLPFNLLQLSNLLSLYKDINHLKCNNIYIGDPYFYRYYTLAYLLVRYNGTVSLLDDGNTSLSLLMDMRSFFSRIKFNILLFYFLRKVNIKYDGYFFKDLQEVGKQNNLISCNFTKILVFGTSISCAGHMSEEDFLNMLNVTFSSCENILNISNVIYNPHPNENTDILKNFKNLKIDRNKKYLDSLSKNSDGVLFLSFSSSISVELALKYPKSKHKIIPLSKFIYYSNSLKREYYKIEKTYNKYGIKSFI